MEKFNLVREIREIKNYLSYSKNIGFFFGAGTSCALGIPNISQLTIEVEGSMTGNLKNNFQAIKTDLKSITGKEINIEDILNQTRRIRELTGERKDKNYQNIDGESAKLLDIEICKKIYEIITEQESKANLENTKKFFAG
jgi:hypothetical protein